MDHITTGLKDEPPNAACWFISMIPLESYYICAFVRPKQHLIICFQPEPTALNHKLARQYITFMEYPDGTVAIMYEGRKINYSIFNKLSGLQQNEVVEHKRLGSVLTHIQQQHEELEKQNKRTRAKKSMPSRKAQKAIIEQRNLNPVLDACS